MPPRFVDRPIQAMSMNIFRLCGDMSHVFSIIVLLLRLRVAKNASGELKEWIRRRWLCSFASLFFCCCCVGSDDIWPWTTAPETDCKMRTPQWRSIGTGIVSLRAAKEEAEAVWFATALSVDFRPGILYCKCEIFVFEGPEKAYWFHTCFSSSYVHVLCSLSARHLVRSCDPALTVTWWLSDPCAAAVVGLLGPLMLWCTRISGRRYLCQNTRAVPCGLRNAVPRPVHDILLAVQLLHEGPVYCNDGGYYLHDPFQRANLLDVR